MQVAATTALLPIVAAAAADGVGRDVPSDAHPSVFDTPGIIATLAVAGGLLLLLGVWLLREHRAGAARLPSVLMALEMSSVLTVAIGTWALTYVSAFNSLHENANKLITKSGDNVKLRFDRVLREGRQTAEAAAAMMSFYNAPPPGYPHTQRALLTAHRVYSGSAVTLVYFGGMDGRFLGVGNFGEDYVVVRDGSPASDLRLSCSDPDRRPSCMHPACNLTCDFCITVWGEVLDGVTCPSWSPPYIDYFNVSSDPREWDLPPRTAANVGYCDISSDGVGDVVPSTRLDGAPGRLWKQAPFPRCMEPFDPRVRDWFVMDRGHWVVYEFSSFTEFESVPARGLTVSEPVRHSDSGELFGVVGVDFTLQSLTQLAKDSRPTPGSVLFFVEESGLIAASSLDVHEFSDVVASNNGGGRALSPKPLLSDWRWRVVFQSVVNHYGSIENATTGAPHILQSGGGANLVDSVAVGDRLRWLLVIHVPYADVTGDAEDASVLALAVVVAVGLCSGVGLSALIFNVLRPLQLIVSQMAQVAQLQLDDLEPPPGSFARELQRLRHYYLGMVDALRYYRDFMPQSMVEGAGCDASEEPSEHVQAPCPLVVCRLDTADSVSSPTRTSVASEHSRTLRSSFTSGVLCPTDHRLVQRRVSLLEANVRQWLGTVEASQSCAALHTRYVASCVEAVRIEKGIADSLLGDRVLMNFNGVRANGQHALRATQAALRIAQQDGLAVSSGLSSGKCLCGNMGAAGLRAYAIVGPPASMVHACERAATRWSLPCVSDRVVYQEVAFAIVCKLLCLISYRKGGSDAPAALYEPIRALEQTDHENEEWMYQVGTTAPFQHRNTAAEKLLLDGVKAGMDCCVQYADSEGVEELTATIAESNQDTFPIVFEYTDTGGLPAQPPLKDHSCGKRCAREMQAAVSVASVETVS